MTSLGTRISEFVPSIHCKQSMQWIAVEATSVISFKREQTGCATKRNAANAAPRPTQQHQLLNGCLKCRKLRKLPTHGTLHQQLQLR